MSKQRSELASLLRNADSLLGRAQTTADRNLRNDIDKLRETTNPTSTLWSSLLSEASKPEIKEAAQYDRLLNEAVHKLITTYSDIAARELNGFHTSTTGGTGTDFKNRRYDIDLAFIRPGYPQPKGYTKYSVRVTGNELEFAVLDRDKETSFYATALDHPVYWQEFTEAVKGAAGPQLKSELDRSD